MMGLTAPGSTVWISESDSPTRKYRHTWELVEVDLGKGPLLVGINTGHPTSWSPRRSARVASKALAGYAELRREVNYGRNSRIDILLQCSDQRTVLRRDQERAPVAPARPCRVSRFGDRSAASST
jgi:DNA-binding sugar fermentation-stimulating protein